MSWLFGGVTESDDPSVLPRDMQMVYEDPWKILEVGTTPSSYWRHA